MSWPTIKDVIASAHVAAGALAGMAGARFVENRAGRIAAAFGLGLLSHIVLDAIPHSDYRPLAPSTVLLVAACEMVAMSVIIGFMLRKRLEPRGIEYLLAGVAGSVLPDLKFAAALFLPQQAAMLVRQYGDQFHSFFHAPRPSSPLAGLGLEVACTLVLLAALSVFPKRTRESV